MNTAPVFAVLGHPNEGKSSVVATLAENTRIRISPTPGETMAAREYPVHIDGECVLRFVDTPGFQNPALTLGWMQRYCGPEQDLLDHFLEEFQSDPGMAHECELLRPVALGAGIIFVVDASRPLRRVDLAEMEIVRRTGRPRMAILNCKTGEEDFLEDWKNELRKHFNMVRTFNAIRATFVERVRLLESLRALEQDWEAALDRVVDAFTRDWNRRNRECAALACEFLGQVLSWSETAALRTGTSRTELEETLTRRLEERIRCEEQCLHRVICAQFRHDDLAFLPRHSILRDDLFARETWSAFGLSKTQLVAGAVAAGGAAGAVLDLATLGHSVGLCAAASGAVAGLAVLIRGERLVTRKVLGVALGQRTVQIGPVHSVQWMYILLDRFLLHYWYVTHWAHALRDQDFLPVDARAGEKLGLSSTWDRTTRSLCADYFAAQIRGVEAGILEQELVRFLEKQLHQLSAW